MIYNSIKLVAISTVLLLGLTSNPTQANSSGDLIYYSPPSGRETAEGNVAIWTGETNIFGDQHGWLPNEKNAAYLAIFPVCDLSKYGNCIESVSTRRLGTNKWFEGRPVIREIPTDIGRSALVYSDGTPPNVVGFTREDVAKGIPAGSSPSIWDLPIAPHVGGSRYWLSVAVGSDLSGSSLSGFSRFNVVLRPIDNQEFSEPLYFVPFQRGYNFPTGFEYRVAIRLGLAEKVLPKFFYGRMIAPNIELDENRLIISGRPGIFPVARTGWIPYSVSRKAQRLGLPH